MEFPDVEFSRSNWVWREVLAAVAVNGEIGFMIQTKLLLVRETGEAVYFGNGDELLCRILDLEIVEGKVLYRRRNRKGEFATVRRMRPICGILSAALVGEGFAQFATSGDDHYFTREGESLHALRVDVNVEGESTPVKILQLCLPDGRLGAAYEIPMVILEGRVERARSALVGEMRKVVRFNPPDSDGRYHFSPSRSEIMAVKVVVHALGAIPASTRDVDPQFQGQRENPMNEMKAMDLIARTPNGTPGNLGHPNIMRFLDVLADERFVFIVLPLVAGGDMFDNPVELNSLQIMRGYVRQIASAIAFLHALGICHCDITPHNILVDTTTQFAPNVFRLLLCDFGQARWHPMDPFQLLPPTGDQWGCPPGKIECFCPENTHSAPYSGFKVDIWQFGSLLVQMCTRSAPFVKKPKRKAEDPEQQQQQQRVPMGTFADAPDGTPSRWFEMVRQRQHRQTRMQTRTNVGIRFPFWPELFDIAERALHIDPQQRPTIADLCPGAIVAGLLPAVDPAHLQPQQAPQAQAVEASPALTVAAAGGGEDGGVGGGGDEARGGGGETSP